MAAPPAPSRARRAPRSRPDPGSRHQAAGLAHSGSTDADAEEGQWPQGRARAGSGIGADRGVPSAWRSPGPDERCGSSPPPLDLDPLPNQANGHGIPVRRQADPIIFGHDARDPRLLLEAALASKRDELAAFLLRSHERLLNGSSLPLV